MHRFHSISIRILFSKHGSPFASFTFHMLSHKYTMDFNAGITRIKRTKRKTRPKRSIRSLGMGVSLPPWTCVQSDNIGGFQILCLAFAAQIGWKRLLLIVFSSGHFSWLFSPLFSNHPEKNTWGSGWTRTSHTPAKPKSCCCIPEPVMKNAWENSSMMLDKTWWWCFFVLFFFKTSTPCQLLKLSRLVGVEIEESEVAMEKQRVWHVMKFCLPQCFVESRCFESNWFCSFFKLIYFLKTNMSYHKWLFLETSHVSAAGNIH